MPEARGPNTQSITLRINGKKISVSAGTSVAAALVANGIPCRTSVHGAPRGPLCGMGICHECRATVNGVPHQITCQRMCETEMEVSTDA